MFFYGAAYQKTQSAVFMLPVKGVKVLRLQLSSEQSVDKCLDYAAGLEKISTGEVPRL